MAAPDPVADPVSVTQELPDDVQAHADWVVTVIVPVPPPGGAVMLTGLAAKVHEATGCVTTKLLPAIDSVPILPTVVELAAAVNATLPEPVPPVPPEIVIHALPLVAVQLQPGVVVTVTVPPPPVAGTAWLVGEIVNEQGAAPWLTVNVLPPTVNVPVREVVAVLAATL